MMSKTEFVVLLKNSSTRQKEKMKKPVKDTKVTKRCLEGPRARTAWEEKGALFVRTVGGHFRVFHSGGQGGQACFCKA